MGSPTVSGIRVVCRSVQSGFVIVLLLAFFMNACHFSSTATGGHGRPSRRGIIFQIKGRQWKNDEDRAGRCPTSVAVERGVRLALGHIRGSCSSLRAAHLSRTEAVVQSLERDRSRVKALRSRTAGNVWPLDPEAVNLPLESGRILDTGNYIVAAGFGTPAQSFLLTVDTGSDITWIQCRPCGDCYSQADPIFDPSQSSSYTPVGCLSRDCAQVSDATGYSRSCSLPGGCFYGVLYGDGSETRGEFARETLTLASDSFRDFAFGCGHSNSGLFRGYAGVMGLGRNALGLPSQTAAQYLGLFSYCLPDFDSPDASGSLSFGQSAIPSSGVFTKLLTNPLAPSLYYVGLSGIGVGGRRLDIPSGVFEQSADGGGTIIDSGTVISRLSAAAYDALKEAFLQQTSSLPRAPPFSILDTCYDLSAYSRVSIPTVTLHFEDGGEVEVNGIGILMPVNDDGSQLCLAFAPTSDDLNIIGNFQQQRFRISYDTRDGRVGFSAESCTA